MRRDFRALQEGIKDIEREYRAMRLAAERLIIQSEVDPMILKAADIRPADLLRAASNLEANYFVRLFAEFEVALRAYWRTVRDTQPKAEDLIHAVGSRLRVEPAFIQNVHSARIYRNSLVHEQDESIAFVSIVEARRSTCLFLGYLSDKNKY